MLIANQICKSYQGRLILHEVDISITPGRITALIGPSGGGKTTLVKTLSLLDCPDSGTILLDDEAHTFPSSTNLARNLPWPKLTVVFQQHFLWPHLTLRENILLPLRGLRSKASFEDLIETFQMKEFIDRYPNQVSLGQRQRAALARAFTLNPKYILLDEITSALDVEQTSILLEHLLLLRQRGIGILVVTHHLGFARQLISKGEGDQVVFLESGRVLGSGGKRFFDEQTNPRIAQFISASKITSF